ncbi:DNA-directed RNA polymerase subunit H [archaeon]|nr:DNA-directed RNA polymerase subunit H [archaeon]
MAEEFDIKKHSFVPVHIKLTEEEAQKVLEEFNVTKDEIPKILISDPAIENLKPDYGDLIKIIRKSPTNTESTFFRVVVNG